VKKQGGENPAATPATSPLQWSGSIRSAFKSKGLHRFAVPHARLCVHFVLKAFTTEFTENIEILKKKNLLFFSKKSRCSLCPLW
jgi:hypothetical protein